MDCDSERGFFIPPLRKMNYSPGGFRNSSWKQMGDISLPLFRLSKVSELMLRFPTQLLIDTARSEQCFAKRADREMTRL